MHSDAACVAENVPAGQAVHFTEALSEYVPGTHAEHLVAPGVSDTLPATQLVHCVAPLPSKNVPAGQVLQFVVPISRY